MGIRAGRLRPELGAVTGWLSGPAIRPIALRAIHEVARELPEVPILGSGGVKTSEDAVEMLLAGAWAVQVGTAALVDPTAPVEVAAGVTEYLKTKGFGSPEELRGRLRLPANEGVPG
jgi:dihydroorotate dehydrogenase (NAD+) catalytic subunit